MNAEVFLNVIGRSRKLGIIPGVCGDILLKIVTKFSKPFSKFLDS